METSTSTPLSPAVKVKAFITAGLTISPEQSRNLDDRKLAYRVSLRKMNILIQDHHTPEQIKAFCEAMGKEIFMAIDKRNGGDTSKRATTMTAWEKGRLDGVNNLMVIAAAA
jgi:hypothetical protein